MSKILSTVLLLFFYCFDAFSQSPEDVFLKYFLSALTSENKNSNDLKKISLIENLVPGDIDFTTTSNIFSNELFDYTVNHAYESYKTDIDHDGEDEILTLICEGSGRYPYFYIFKKTNQSMKYKQVACYEKNVFLTVINNTKYFIETIRDFNSGRISKYIAYLVNTNYELIQKAEILVNYKYELSSLFSNYIDSNTINNISQQNYKIFGITDKKKSEFNIDLNNSELHVKIHFTTVGYMPTTVDLEVEHNNNVIKKFEKIWGFNVIDYNNEKFISILEMDEKIRVASIQDFKLSVWRIRDWKIISSDYIVAKKEYKLTFN